MESLLPTTHYISLERSVHTPSPCRVIHTDEREVGFIMSCLYFAVLWPIAILCLAPYYSSRNMAHSYAPQLIKLVYGTYLAKLPPTPARHRADLVVTLAFILGFLQNPIVAMIAMGSEDAVRDHRREVQDQAIVDLEGRGPMPNTWAESIARPEPAHGKD